MQPVSSCSLKIGSPFRVISMSVFTRRVVYLFTTSTRITYSSKDMAILQLEGRIKKAGLRMAITIR